MAIQHYILYIFSHFLSIGLLYITHSCPKLLIPSLLGKIPSKAGVHTSAPLRSGLFLPHTPAVTLFVLAMNEPTWDRVPHSGGKNYRGYCFWDNNFVFMISGTYGNILSNTELYAQCMKWGNVWMQLTDAKKKKVSLKKSCYSSLFAMMLPLTQGNPSKVFKVWLKSCCL